MAGRYIAVAGRYSLEIYVMHMFLVKFLPVVPDGVMENDIYSYLYFGGYGLVTVVLIILFSKYVFEKIKGLEWMIGRSRNV